LIEREENDDPVFTGKFQLLAGKFQLLAGKFRVFGYVSGETNVVF
jgi:hypothetical protein